jgi:hypothetical protein
MSSELPKVIADTQPIPGAPQLIYVYGLGGDEDGATDTSVPVPVESPCCFTTQENLKAIYGIHKGDRRCPICRQARDEHMLKRQAVMALQTHRERFPEAGVNKALGRRVQQLPQASEQLEQPEDEEFEGNEDQKNEQLRPQDDMERDDKEQEEEPEPQVRRSIPERKMIISTASPSTSTTHRDWKVLSEIAKLKEAVKWNSKSFARDFIDSMEAAVRQSPVPPTQWIFIIPMMIPATERNMLEYVDQNIIQPLVSWNKAKQIFVQHYQSQDWVDIQRSLYNNCTQGTNESVQKYSDRFMALAKHLQLTDGDMLNIQNYMNGLKIDIQHDMFNFRMQMRDLPLGPDGIVNPTWEYTSLRHTSQKAIAYDAMHITIRHQRKADPSVVSKRAQDSSNTNQVTSESQPSNNKRKHTQPSTTSTSKKQKQIKSCKYHPKSVNHSTSECRSEQSAPGATTITTSETKDKQNTATSSGGNKITTNKSKTRNVTCYECGAKGHYKPDCPTLKNGAKTKSGTPSTTRTGSNTSKVNLRAVTFAPGTVTPGESDYSDEWMQDSPI